MAAVSSGWKQFFYNNLLLVCLAVAMVVGIIIGFAIRGHDPDFGDDKRKVMYLEFPGELLMRMLKMIVMPIIVTSMTSGNFAICMKIHGQKLSRKSPAIC